MNQIPVSHIKTSRLLSRLVANRNVVDSRRLLSSDDFRLALLKERDRAERRHISFGLVVVHLPSDKKTLREQWYPTLIEPLRFPDEVGLLDEKTVCVLLPDTEPDETCKMAAEFQEQLVGKGIQVRVEVFFYPHDEIDNNEINDDSAVESSATPRSTHDEPIDFHIATRLRGETREIVAGPFSFLVPVPLWKRIFDFTVSVLLLILLSPLFLLSALLIRLSSPGPIFFSQWREGRGGEKFRIFKFRTMVADADSRQAELRYLNEQDGPAFKIENDPRLTWIGSILRKSCIDEIPQLWNVIRGDMSLVGPRPLPVNESLACTRRQRRRLDVLPGMTCYGQLYGTRKVSFDEWMMMDERYVRECSLLTDMHLLGQTFLYVLVRRASV